MKTNEILREIERLPISKSIFVVEKTIHSICTQEDKNLMTKAADILAADYLSDKELTAFQTSILKIFMKQNDVWLINFDPTVGEEIKKTRPAIIVNDDSLGKLPLK